MSEEKEPAFKVSDRRLFNFDGTLRPDSEVIHEEAPVLDSALMSLNERSEASSAALLTEDTTDEGREVSENGDLGRFSEFVMELATNAMMMLGMMDHPQYGRIPPDLASARHFIDLLGMLQEKTRNNLTAAESRHLNETIDALRMQYVGLSQRR